MVAAANPALSATADGNQKKPPPGFIPPGLTPPKAGWNSIPPLSAPEGARSIYAGMGNAAASPETAGRMMSNAAALANRPLMDTAAPAPTIPAQPQPATSGVGGIPTGGPAGWTGGQPAPKPQAAFGDFQATVQNQVEQALTGRTFSKPPSMGLPGAPAPSPAATATPPAPAPAPAAPAATTARPSPASGPASPTVGVGAPVVAPTVDANGKVAALGSGTQVGGGVVRYDVPGQSPLFTNMTGQEGINSNLGLLNRGQVSAQNQAAMDNMVARSGAEITQGVQRAQFQDQVARAQAINALPTPADPRAAMDITSPQYQAARLQRMEMEQKSGESPSAYQTRMQAMAESQRLAQSKASGEAELGLRRDTLAANTRQADARLGLDAQRLAGDQETGAVTREKSRMEIDQAKKLQALQDRYLSATGAEQEAIGKQIQALAGKESRGDWKLQVTPATKNADGSTSAGSIVRYNERTGQVEQVGGGQGAQAASGGKPEVNKTYTRSVNGVPGEYRFKGTDANGKEQWESTAQG